MLIALTLGLTLTAMPVQAGPGGRSERRGIISIREPSKRFRATVRATVRAVDGVRFEIMEGEFFALLGIDPNRRPVSILAQSHAVFRHIAVAHNVGYGLKVVGEASGDALWMSWDAADTLVLTS